MKNSEKKDQIDSLISNAIGKDKPEPDFNKWLSENRDTVKIIEERANRDVHRDFSPGLLLQFWKARFVKLAVAATVCIAFFGGLNFFSNPFSDSKVAWAKVTNNVAAINFTHLYRLQFSNNAVNDSSEAWFSDGKVFWLNSDKSISYDDGREKLTFDAGGSLVNKQKTDLGGMSNLTKDANMFDKLMQGVLQYKDEELAGKIPSRVGEDFIVYHFTPSEFAGLWCNEISVTVGRNSLLPVQMKIVLEPGSYDLYIFDYELDGGFEKISNEMLPKLN